MGRFSVSESVARAVWLLAGVSWVVACDSARSAANGFEVLEVQGVRTTLSHTPALEAGSWALAAGPRVQIGAVEGEEPYLFQRISYARILPGGEIVVVDGGASVVREYTPEGVHIRSQGRPGEGPGEYRNIVQVLPMAGDTLVLVQFPGRYSFVEGDGTFVRSWVPANLPGPSGFLSSDRMVWTLTSGAAVESGPVSRTRTLVLGDAEGATGDTIAVLDGGEYVLVHSGSIVANVFVPFALGGIVATDPPGRLITSGDGWELVYHDLELGTESRVRLDREPRPVTGGDWDRAVEEALSQRRGVRNPMPDLVRAWEQGLGQAGPPESMPAFDGLLVDREGNVWAEEFVPPYEHPAVREWDVFDGDGRWITTVPVPSDFDVLDIGADYVVVRWSDALGVERIRVYDLLKRR